jgi:spore coat protein U-like protein
MKTQKLNSHVLSLAVASILAVGVGAFSVNSYAVPPTANLAVSATISANCTIDTTAVAFGAYDPIVTNLTAAKDGTGSVKTVCTTGSSPIVTLGQGLQALGDVPAAPVRQMASGTNRLGYFLYQDSGHGTLWGNTAGTGKAPAVINGQLDTLTVYGQITGAQNVPTGEYTDTVIATVTF